MKYRYARIRVEHLMLDHTYQRDFDEKRAIAMAETYDPGREGVFFVSQRGDEKFAILDGQHRYQARLQAGHRGRVYCCVYEGMSVTEEADMFLRLNGGRTAVGPVGRRCEGTNKPVRVAETVDAASPVGAGQAANEQQTIIRRLTQPTRLVRIESRSPATRDVGAIPTPVAAATRRLQHNTGWGS